MRVREISLKLIAVMLIILIYNSCKEMSGDLNNVKKDAIWGQVFYQGIYNLDYRFDHGPSFKSEIEVINESNTTILLGFSKNDKFLILDSNREVLDSTVFGSPIMVEPKSRDTMFVTIPLFRDKPDPDKYLDASIVYIGSDEYNIDSVFNIYYDGQVKPWSYRVARKIEFQFTKSSQRIIENNVIE